MHKTCYTYHASYMIQLFYNIVKLNIMTIIGKIITLEFFFLGTLGSFLIKLNHLHILIKHLIYYLKTCSITFFLQALVYKRSVAL